VDSLAARKGELRLLSQQIHMHNVTSSGTWLTVTSKGDPLRGSSSTVSPSKSNTQSCRFTYVQFTFICIASGDSQKDMPIYRIMYVHCKKRLMIFPSPPHP
jgi:hypothetical protein